MATLVGNVNSSARSWTVSTAIPSEIDYLAIDSETVEVLTHTPSQLDPQTRAPLPAKISVRRAAGGTTAASHTSGTTLTPVIPPAASGDAGSGVTVDNTVDPPAAVTTIIAPGAVIAGDEATLVTVAIYKRTTTLTNVQIKALPTTSIELVPAPGADKLLQLVFAIGVLDTQAAAYVAGTPGELSITHTDGGRRSVNYMESDQAAFASQALTHIWWLPSTSAITGEEFASTGTLRPNDALQLLNVNGADYTGGNAANTLKVTVWYGIVDL